MRLATYLPAEHHPPTRMERPPGAPGQFDGGQDVLGHGIRHLGGAMASLRGTRLASLRWLAANALHGFHAAPLVVDLKNYPGKRPQTV